MVGLGAEHENHRRDRALSDPVEELAWRHELEALQNRGDHAGRDIMAQPGQRSGTLIEVGLRIGRDLIALPEFRARTREEHGAGVTVGQRQLQGYRDLYTGQTLHWIVN